MRATVATMSTAMTMMTMVVVVTVVMLLFDVLDERWAEIAESDCLCRCATATSVWWAIGVRGSGRSGGGRQLVGVHGGHEAAVEYEALVEHVELGEVLAEQEERPASTRVGLRQAQLLLVAPHCAPVQQVRLMEVRYVLLFHQQQSQQVLETFICIISLTAFFLFFSKLKRDR